MAEDTIVLRMESGDDAVLGQRWEHALYMAAGSDPYALVESAVAGAAALSGGSKPLREKQLPPTLDVFGWCTWDAFYSRVSARGAGSGLGFSALTASHTVHPQDPICRARPSSEAVMANKAEQQGSKVLSACVALTVALACRLARGVGQPGERRRAAAVPHHRRRVAVHRRGPPLPTAAYHAHGAPVDIVIGMWFAYYGPDLLALRLPFSCTLGSLGTPDALCVKVAYFCADLHPHIDRIASPAC